MSKIDEIKNNNLVKELLVLKKKYNLSSIETTELNELGVDVNIEKNKLEAYVTENEMHVIYHFDIIEDFELKLVNRKECGVD